MPFSFIRFFRRLSTRQLVIALHVRLTGIEATLARIEHPSTSEGFVFHVVGIVPRLATGGNMPLEVSCTTEEKVRIRIAPKTNAGNPATIQVGSLAVVSTSGDGVATLEDDVTFTIQGDALASSTFEVSGDADLGDGVTNIVDVVTLNVTSANATNLGLGQVEVVPR